MLDSPCLTAPGARNSKGYGLAHVEGKRTTAHRAAYVRHNGLTLADIAGQVVRHKCDNRGCIEPTHLEIGTYQQNTQDMLDRGREARGFALPQTKLSLEDCDNIRAMRNMGARNMDLAARFNVACSTISRITGGDRVT